MALHSVMMQARALHHDHFQRLSASQSSFVSPISSSRNQFRSFTPKSFGCCRPVTGSFSQCALSLKGGGRAPPGVSCFPGSLRYRKRSADGRRMWHIAAQPSEPSTSTFNEEDYEEHEDTEEEARRRDWVERRWAPWEELLSPEAEFAVESLAPGEEEPVVSRESFEKLNPKWQEEHRKKLLEEAKRKEKERKPPTLEGSIWDLPLVFALIPPRDWPPPGWKVDAKELAFIREAHSLENVWVKSDDLKDAVEDESMEGAFPRWKMFLKQYDEWVAANKERLDHEAQEVDPEYYPGRRRLGEDYREGMYELPFIYPGQHYWGVVSCVSLYEGAFVHIGAVHDGWVPIQDNDWYYIRDFIKVGMHVQVEVIAKRDPYRFRFPIELRFVDPNIDDMIFHRFEHPPIFARPGDDDLDEVARESNRPYWPKLRPEKSAEDEEEQGCLVHPAVPRLWQLYQAEEMVLDEEDGVEEDTEYIGLVDDAYSDADDGYDEEGEEEDNEEEYPGYEETFEPQWFEGGARGCDIPTLVLNTDPAELNLDAARKEREEFKCLWEEAMAKGEEFVPPKNRLDCRVEELNVMHNERKLAEKEALMRDTACRIELGLPLEEPGRYADKEFWGKNPYDPREPRWRHDYWGDPSKMKDELRREKEPRSARTVGAVVEEEEDDLVEGKEEDEEEVDELDRAESATVLQKVKEERGTVNGTATIRMDNIRGMFSRTAEEDDVLDVKNELREQDKGDEGDDADEPSTNM
ncbi:unnamed protein product [Sphagnum balticum]